MVDMTVKIGNVTLKNPIMPASGAFSTDLKLASLRRDKELVATAREVAFDLVDHDPGLEGLPQLADEVRFLVDDDDRQFLFKG